MKIFIYIYLFGFLFGLNHADRVAPGVPPQHYMGQNVQHKQQGQQYQMNQVPVQQQQLHQVHQQVPVNQVPLHQAPVHQAPVHQAPVHQAPVHQAPVHQAPIHQAPMQQQVPVQNVHHQPHAHQGQILNAANIAHEKDHIAEHLEVPIDTSKMTEQELQFHYFKMHDADNNNKLDGCELIKSLIHWHEQGGKERTPQGHVEEKIFRDDELIALIDPILGMDDGNRDGYIDYPEFVRAQQKAAATQKSA